MNPIAWLLGLVLPACGFPGAGGLPAPAPMDLGALVRPGSPNTAWAAPAGSSPPPDRVTPVFDHPPDRLFAAIRAVAADQPRTFLHAEHSALRQAHYVVRSRIFNFPDLVTVGVEPVSLGANPGTSAGTSAGGSTLKLYSRSVYGYSDLGANRARIDAWLDALDRHLRSNIES